jgi:prepilin-type N-terminal cleavage/methylation domain-containing protein/prepilin-type processing-associated H-X9-DG protein
MMLTMPRTRRHPAFTLIELLVVVAILTVLIGLVLPALAGARVQARLTKCTTNARSIGQGLALYAADRHETLPSWSGWQVRDGDGAPPDNPGQGWTEQIQADLPGLEPYHCPARDQALAPYSYFLSAKYTFARLGKAYTSLRDTDIHFPAQFVLSGDCNQPELFSKPYGNSDFPPDCDQDDATFPPLFFAGELAPHRGQSNILFFDTHVAPFTSYVDGVMTWHGTKMTDWSLLQ